MRGRKDDANLILTHWFSAYTLELPRKHLKIPMSRPHPRPMKSESQVSTVFKAPQAISLQNQSAKPLF